MTPQIKAALETGVGVRVSDLRSSYARYATARIETLRAQMLAVLREFPDAMTVGELRGALDLGADDDGPEAA